MDSSNVIHKVRLRQAAGEIMNPAENDSMKPPGETAEARFHKPKAQRFAVLAALWLLVSPVALLILARGYGRWREAAGPLDWLRRVAVEEWVAMALLVSHAVFAWLAWRYHRHERPCRVDLTEAGAAD